MAKYEDKRAFERFPVNATTACVFASPVLEDFGPVKILNISTHGIGLYASETLHADLMLAVKLVNPAKSFSRTMLVRVVHVTPQGSGFLVGGIFETPLTYEELCIFVM